MRREEGGRKPLDGFFVVWKGLKGLLLPQVCLFCLFVSKACGG